MTLDMLKNGETAVIKTVGGEGALRLRFLDMGLFRIRPSLFKRPRPWATR